MSSKAIDKVDKHYNYYYYYLDITELEHMLGMVFSCIKFNVSSISNTSTTNGNRVKFITTSKHDNN